MAFDDSGPIAHSRMYAKHLLEMPEDLLTLILNHVYSPCVGDYKGSDKFRSAIKFIPYIYVCRRFAQLILPKIWRYVRIVPNSRNTYNLHFIRVLQKDNPTFSYGNYLKTLVVNFTAHFGDERRANIPVASLLKVVAKHCPNLKQITFEAHASPHSLQYGANFINGRFKLYLEQASASPWHQFRTLFESAFTRTCLTEVTLVSDFVLVDDNCLIALAQRNRKIQTLRLLGDQFTNDGIVTAVSFIGNSLKQLEIVNVIHKYIDNAAPIELCIEQILSHCTKLQQIHLTGIKYKPADEIIENEPTDASSSNDSIQLPLDDTCPLSIIQTSEVDEVILERLFQHTSKQTLVKVDITSSLESIKWQRFIVSSILPFAREGILKEVYMMVKECRTHFFSENTLDARIIMKNIGRTLQISEDIINSLKTALDLWDVSVGRRDEKNSISERVDFVEEKVKLMPVVFDVVI